MVCSNNYVVSSIQGGQSISSCQRAITYAVNSESATAIGEMLRLLPGLVCNFITQSCDIMLTNV